MAPLRFVVIAFSALILMAFTLDRPWEEHTLRVLAFPDALTPAVIRDFQASTGAKVEVEPYGGAMDLLAPGATPLAEGFDVLLAAESLVLPLAFRGHLQPLHGDALPNGLHLDDSLLEGPAWSYARPYLVGVTGMAYRRDKLPLPPSTWAAALDPDAPWAGRVLLLNERRQALGVALKALGASVNEERPYIVTQAGRWLEERLDVLGGLDSLTPLERLGTGDVWMAQSYSGDVKRRQDRRIAFYIPEEGGLLYADIAAIGTNAEEAELGEVFINYLMHPVVAQRLALGLGRSVPNRGSARLGGLPLQRLGFAPKRPASEGLRPVGGASLAFDVAWARIQREMGALQ